MKPLTPPALDHAIRRCLAKDPEERWQSARDLAQELKWIADSSPQASAPAVATSRRRSARELLAWLAAAVLLCLLVALGVASLRNSVPPLVTRSAILPPEDAEFFSLDIEGGAPAISPDGKLLVSAVRNKDGLVQLWVRSLDSQNARVLPGTDGGGHPFWSPDSRSIGFFASSKLKRIDTDGTSLQLICDVGSSPRGGSWNRGGVILFTSGVADPLQSVSANGGTPVAASVMDRNNGENSHRWPQFLPDGEHYLFFTRNWDRARTGIYEGALGSKDHHFVLRKGSRALYVPQGFLLYMREDTLLAQRFDAKTGVLSGEPVPMPDRVAFLSPNSDALFSASDNAVLAYYPSQSGGPGWELVWRDRQGKKLASLGRDFFAEHSISPDGTKVAVAIYDKEWWTPDLWILDLARGSKTRFTFGPAAGRTPVWEPDGKGLFFGLVENGEMHTFHKSLTGSETAQVVLQTKGANEAPGSICRDGSFLVLERAVLEKNVKSVGSGRRANSEALWILPLTGEHREPSPLVQGQFHSGNPRISPDCKWVAYEVDEPSQVQIYVTSAPDGKRTYHVTETGGTNPRWRGDGRELFYISSDRNFTAVSVEERGQELVLGSPHALFPFHGIATRLEPYDVTPDGQKFLVSGSEEPISHAPLTLVVNWDTELKKK